ncbi:reverse transcriptase domain-containing protein [Tanacetum coccineum]
MPPKRTSTSEAPAITQAAIRILVAESVTAALETQAANMANTDNTTRPREAPVARKCSYEEFMSCQPINFKGTEGAIGLIRWFERTKPVFSHSNCTKDCKVKFATGTITEEALSWWNSFAQPIGIEEAYKITWVEFKKLLIKKYCPRIKVQKMEDEFYHLTMKGNDLKTYVKRFQDLATLCPTMVPDSEKMMEVFIGGLPQSIEGNVIASKPQTLEEAINIGQRLMDQVTKHTPVQVSSDHKRKFDDIRTFNNNNYRNDITTTTVTPTTATIITNHNRIEDNKPSGLMLPPQLKIMVILETVLCVRNALCITQDLVLLSVIFATRFTRFRRVPVSAAKQSSLRATTSTSTFRPVNTATHTNRVNVSKLKTNAFHKSHSPIRRSFYKSTAPNTRISNEKVNTVRVNGVNTAGQTTVSAVKGNGVTAVKALAGCVWRPKMTDLNNGNPQQALKYKGIFDSGCSRHMTGNKDFLTDYQDIDGGFVAFGGSARGSKITGKGKIRTDKLDFEDVFFVNELKFNLLSVSQMCDKKNSVLFTKLDEIQVLLRVPKQNNMYNFDLKNVVPSGDLTCLFAKSTINESKLWHRRLGHVNIKTMNKLVKGNLSVYEEDIKLLKREIYLRDLDITELKRKLELATKEKDEVQLTVQKFENSSKNLSKLLDRQIMDKCKTGLGYNAVPPPYTGNFMPPKSDLVYPSLDDFVDVNESVSESVVEKPTIETARKENGAPIIEDWVSDSDEENVPKVKTVKMFNKPSFAKINFVKSTEQVKSPRKTSVDKNRQNTS